MKTNYEILNITLVIFGEDIITNSVDFNGDNHGFGDPNAKGNFIPNA